MQASKYFTIEELTHSDTAIRKGINNTPDSVTLGRLLETAKKMDAVRQLLRAPINVNSGYRSHDLNKIIGGSDTSAHTLGYAVDFTCNTCGTPLQICRVIKASGMQFDQLIQEGTWVHISFDPRMRRQCLTAHFGGGKTTYTEGF